MISRSRFLPAKPAPYIRTGFPCAGRYRRISLWSLMEYRAPAFKRKQMSMSMMCTDLGNEGPTLIVTANQENAEAQVLTIAMRSRSRKPA